MLGLQTTGPGYSHTDNRHGVAIPGTIPRLGVLFPVAARTHFTRCTATGSGPGRSHRQDGGRHD